MTLFRLPSGQRVKVTADHMQLGKLRLTYADAAEFCRVFLTATPLQQGDVRVELVNQIRTSTIRKNCPASKEEWIELNTIALFANVKA